MEINVALPIGFEFPEIILKADIKQFIPERSVSECARCEYSLTGFLRFEPDGTDEAGNPQGLMIALTPAQLEEIKNHFQLDIAITEFISEEHQRARDEREFRRRRLLLETVENHGLVM